jgi:hypothetical protein
MSWEHSERKCAKVRRCSRPAWPLGASIARHTSSSQRSQDPESANVVPDEAFTMAVAVPSDTSLGGAIGEVLLTPNELLVGGVESVESILLLSEAVLSLPVLEDEVCVAHRGRAILVGELQRHCRVVC